MNLHDFGVIARLALSALIMTYVVTDIVGDWLASRAIKKLNDRKGE